MLPVITHCAKLSTVFRGSLTKPSLRAQLADRELRDPGWVLADRKLPAGARRRRS